MSSQRVSTQALAPIRSGWRRAAIAVVAVLAVLVLVTRFDGQQQAAPGIPSAPAVAAQPTSDQAAPTDRPGGEPTVGTGGEIGRSPDGLRYVDGIPTNLNGESVYRVRDALIAATGRTLLVAGWYLRLECEHLGGRKRCGSTTLSDAVIGTWHPGWLATNWIEIDTQLERSAAWIVRATVEEDPDCSIPRAGDCQPRLRVQQAVWSADVSDLSRDRPTPQPSTSERP